MIRLSAIPPSFDADKRNHSIKKDLIYAKNQQYMKVSLMMKSLRIVKIAYACFTIFFLFSSYIPQVFVKYEKP